MNITRDRVQNILIVHLTAGDLVVRAAWNLCNTECPWRPSSFNWLKDTIHTVPVSMLLCYWPKPSYPHDARAPSDWLPASFRSGNGHIEQYADVSRNIAVYICLSGQMCTHVYLFIHRYPLHVQIHVYLYVCIYCTFYIIYTQTCIENNKEIRIIRKAPSNLGICSSVSPHSEQRITS